MMATILRERNGTTYLRKVSREKAGSKATRERLARDADVAAAWYVDAVGDVLSGGIELTTLLRSPDQFARVEEKVVNKWDVQQVSKSWVEEALPKL
jgi:hypothetical protein